MKPRLALQKILRCIFGSRKKTIRKISEETGIPKSTVFDHIQKSHSRAEASGFPFLETPIGQEFLTRMVISSIYTFCIKSGLGAGRIRTFYTMMNLGSHIGISESVLLKMIKQIEAKILKFNSCKEKEIKSKVQDIELVLGVDETWFDKMLLVCQDLPSSYIFTEESADDRSANTWDTVIKKGLKRVLNIFKIHYFVSDRAKALINLAEAKNFVTSVADCFHFKYCINKLLCLSLSSKLKSSKKKLEESIQNEHEELCETVEEKKEQLAEVQFHTDVYVDSMNNISDILHPFYNGNKNKNSKQAQQEIDAELSKIEGVVEKCKITDKKNLLQKAKNQVNDLVSVIDVWNSIKEKQLSKLDLNSDDKNIFINFLLPATYWKQKIDCTKYKPTKERLRSELTKCYKNYDSNSYNLEKYENLICEAQNLCRKFQRASSQVEGRNGYLSMINHNQRNFDDNRLKVLTVVHNFDTYGFDGKTPAQRLFGKKIKHDKIFDFIIENFGELPLPRVRKPQLTRG